MTKRLILFQDAVTNGSPKHVSCMGRGVPRGHNNKISRACPVFMINRAELKSKYQYILRIQITTLFQEVHCVHTNNLY